MAVIYDKYYQTEELFGKPYPELVAFFKDYPKKSKLLDLGCGQGRDAIPLAQIGFDVIGIDNSKVGIEQMNQIAVNKNLTLKGKVANIYEFDNFEEFDFVLLDSMFHFTVKSKRKEIDFIRRITTKVKNECLLIFCVQDTGKKVDILNEAINFEKKLDLQATLKFEYIFEDNKSGHKSKTDYQMIVVKK